MLAQSFYQLATGCLDKTVQLPDTFRYEVVNFIAGELPRWKGRLNPCECGESEAFLTDKLRSHLNSAARHSDGFDVLQFGTEVPDEAVRGRAIDLAAKPCAAVLLIEGRTYTDFETIMPIECKRLPTPPDRDRDEREYVYSARSSTGGIQRFKAGYHGAAHKFGAMIGYVQEDDAFVWRDRISLWIRDLANDEPSSWSLDDLLRPLQDQIAGVTKLQSSHRRISGLEDILIQHLWVAMN